MISYHVNGDENLQITGVFQVSETLMRGPGSDLFDFIVDCMIEFLKLHGLLEKATVDDPYDLGFTFSFPTRQRSLDEADLTSWTKGYTCEGVEGKDIGILLKNAIAKRPELHVIVSYSSVNCNINDINIKKSPLAHDYA